MTEWYRDQTWELGWGRSPAPGGERFRVEAGWGMLGGDTGIEWDLSWVWGLTFQPFVYDKGQNISSVTTSTGTEWDLTIRIESSKLVTLSPWLQGLSVNHISAFVSWDHPLYLSICVYFPEEARETMFCEVLCPKLYRLRLPSADVKEPALFIWYCQWYLPILMNLEKILLRNLNVKGLKMLLWLGVSNVWPAAAKQCSNTDTTSTTTPLACWIKLNSVGLLGEVLWWRMWMLMDRALLLCTGWFIWHESLLTP